MIFYLINYYTYLFFTTFNYFELIWIDIKRIFFDAIYSYFSIFKHKANDDLGKGTFGTPGSKEVTESTDFMIYLHTEIFE